jgi:hypothetical protein
MDSIRELKGHSRHDREIGLTYLGKEEGNTVSKLASLFRVFWWMGIPEDSYYPCRLDF